MKIHLEHLANQILSRAGYALPPLSSFRTDTEAVRALLARLAPMTTAQGLIRLGPDGDGGYLVPDDLDGIEACFSPGVDTVSGFEKDCAERGMEVFLADKSVSQPAEAHERFHFLQRYVGALTNEDTITMDAWIESSLPHSQADLLLQMDIEGAEYETILAMSDDLLSRFRVIVVEFHDLHYLFSKGYFTLLSRPFDKLLQTHTCVHAHPNNCCGTLTRDGIVMPRVVELTFLRDDRVQSPTPATAFPHPLDRDNTAYPHISLPEAWYRHA